MSETEQTPEDEPTRTIEDDGPDITELEDDPAYNPDDEELQEIKGG
jgi:hypothetical protein